MELDLEQEPKNIKKNSSRQIEEEDTVSRPKKSKPDLAEGKTTLKSQDESEEENPVPSKKKIPRDEVQNKKKKPETKKRSDGSDSGEDSHKKKHSSESEDESESMKSRAAKKALKKSQSKKT